MKTPPKRKWNMNKVHGLALIILGFIPVIIWRDGTIAIFTTIVGVGVYRSKESKSHNIHTL